MDEKLTLELLNRYKELAYSRRATLRAVLQQLGDGSRTPDERVGLGIRLIEACGITEWHERPTE